jgi:hypothetical protein
MQGILIELISTAEEVIEERVLPLDVADQQRLGEFALVLEVVKEAILGDTDGAINSSIDVAAKPFSRMAASAASRMRSRLLLLRCWNSCMALLWSAPWPINCTVSPVDARR